MSWVFAVPETVTVLEAPEGDGQIVGAEIHAAGIGLDGIGCRCVGCGRISLGGFAATQEFFAGFLDEREESHANLPMRVVRLRASPNFFSLDDSRVLRKTFSVAGNAGVTAVEDATGPAACILPAETFPARTAEPVSRRGCG